MLSRRASTSATLATGWLVNTADRLVQRVPPSKDADETRWSTIRSSGSMSSRALVLPGPRTATVSSCCHVRTAFSPPYMIPRSACRIRNSPTACEHGTKAIFVADSPAVSRAAISRFGVNGSRLPGRTSTL